MSSSVPVLTMMAPKAGVAVVAVENGNVGVVDVGCCTSTFCRSILVVGDARVGLVAVDRVLTFRRLIMISAVVGVAVRRVKRCKRMVDGFIVAEGGLLV